MKKRNWKKYLFEFISIFIAVVSAFWLNSWNQNRKDRHAETKILTEIHSGLTQDLLDITNNYGGHEYGVKSCNYLRQLIAGKQVGGDSIMLHLFHATRDYVSIQNTSGYESLKSAGLELITNDSLRSKIISMYEFEYKILVKLEEGYGEMQFHDNYADDISNTLSPYFEFDSTSTVFRIKTPIELQETDRNRLLHHLWKIQNSRIFVIGFYKETRDKIEKLLVDLKTEIDQR